MSGSIQPCETPPPCGISYARLYPRGWCCDLHTPAALQGHPEPPPGPGWPAGAYLNLAAAQAEAEQSEEQEQST